MRQNVVFFNRESTWLFPDVPAWWNLTLWTDFLVYDEGPFLNYQPCNPWSGGAVNTSPMGPPRHSAPSISGHWRVQCPVPQSYRDGTGPPGWVKLWNMNDINGSQKKKATTTTTTTTLGCLIKVTQSNIVVSISQKDMMYKFKAHSRYPMNQPVEWDGLTASAV